jgi:hypothetical protein
LESVRSLLRQKQWCGEVEIIESIENKGLAASICGGISTVLESFDRVIVLEDDLETSPGFLSYMNSSLEVYKEEDKVMQISGFMVKNRPLASPTGFLRVSTSWGWATWRRAWLKYRSDVEKLSKEVEKKGKSEFDLDGYSFHFEELTRNMSGELNTWAVRWYASIFLNNGLCLYPKKSLVRNIGFDGTGENCHESKSNYFQGMSLATRVKVKPGPVKESNTYLKAMQNHYGNLLKEWTGTRLSDRVRKKIHRSLARILR